MEFNKRSRNTNALLASSSGVLLQFVQIFGNFFYRTVFLMFLSKEYLGINGLFTNILQLFSLAELGIGSAILYSMYQPFAQQDTGKIGALVRFYNKVYNFLAVLIIVLGFLFYPFIGTLVNVSEIPPDINLTVIYGLFVARSAFSYLFVYKQSLLTADQQSHLISLFSCVLQILGYGVKILILFLTKDFHLVLLGEIIITLVLNGIFSIWITGKYKSVFQTTDKLSKTDRKNIFTHTYGLLCHKIGYIVVTSTDNIILAKFISLAAVGIYSNYATLVTAITNVMARILNALVPSIANYTLTKTKEESYGLFKRVLFVDLWLSSFTTICLFLLLNPFITLWLDETFLMPQFAVAMICLQHYLQSARLAAGKFIDSCGLFHLDKARPLVESAINLAVSIILAKYIGITGVFIGTVVSGLLTYYWREPYLLFKNYLQRSSLGYWGIQIKWLALTVALCAGMHWLLSLIPTGIGWFVLRIALAAVIPNCIILLACLGTDELRYLLDFVKRKFLRKA